MALLVELVANVFGFAIELAANASGRPRWRIWASTWLSVVAGLVLFLILASPVVGWLALAMVPVVGFFAGCAWQRRCDASNAGAAASGAHDEIRGPRR
ncbi:MAG: YwiC-like family protein [Planctomycetota bacterium]